MPTISGAKAGGLLEAGPEDDFPIGNGGETMHGCVPQ